jgi:hypothetical protein
MKTCPHFSRRQQELWPKGDRLMPMGPCRYHLGGRTCTRRNVFICETNGKEEEEEPQK